MKKIIFVTMASLLLIGTALVAQAAPMQQNANQQEKPMSKAELRKQKKAEMAARQIFIVDSILKIRKFTFVAEQNARVSAGQNVTSRATLIVDGSTVFSQLPYVGGGTASGYGSSVSPLEFTSNSISYQTFPLDKKNGKVFVVINAKPTSGSTTYTIGIEVFDSGEATLSILINGGNGQAFYGNIQPTEENHK